MTKQKNKNAIVKEIAVNNKPPSVAEHKTKQSLIPFLLSGYVPYIILTVLSFVLYGNTLHHQYALDDEVVICKNEAVLNGLAGTPKIFKDDLFESYYKQNNASAQLSGGRYRPLSVFSFALEQQFIGTHPDANFENNCWDTNENGQPDIEEDLNKDGVFNIKDCYSKGFTLRHFNNILLYALACCALYLLLSTVVFKKQKLLALIVSLLFVAHPLHTEVVANVKSRDEILSFLFIALTLYLVHQYSIKQKLAQLLLALLCFFCALLSKEYAVLLLVFVPLSIYLFSGKPFHIKNYIGLFSGMLILLGAYYLLRIGATSNGSSTLQDKELLNNPYLLATASQAMATKIFVLLKYLLLCLFPFKLSSDYGYNSIPYKSFGDISVWASIIILIALIVAGIVALIKKHWLAFAIAFYVLTLLLVTNLFFNVGATIGERLAFHASLGYCMALGAAIVWLTKNKGNLSLIILLPVLLLYSIKTFSRNPAWENNNTLPLTDVKTMPESALLNGNASLACIDLSEQPANKTEEKNLIVKAIRYGRKAVEIHPGMGSAYLNLGLAYAKLDEFDSSLYMLNKAFTIYPHHPNKTACYNFLADAIYRKGNSLGAQQKWTEGVDLFNKAIALNPSNARYWYDMGGYLYNMKDLAKAKQAWLRAYQLDPRNADIQKVQGIIK